jgi:Na+/H+-dicarboxylate symporter
MGIIEIIGILSLIISVLSVIVSLGVFRIVRPKNKVYYKTQADNEFDKLKNKLTDVIYDDPYEGGMNKIFNQLTIENLNHKLIDIDPKYRKYRKIVTFYVIENGERRVKVWYIK